MFIDDQYQCVLNQIRRQRYLQINYFVFVYTLVHLGVFLFVVVVVVYNYMHL